MGPYEMTPDGNRFIFVVTDTFSKWTEAFACRNASSRTTISFLEDQVFSRFGYPQAIISDNGPHFVEYTFQTALGRWKARHGRTAIYHPQANPAERRNHEIKKLLRILGEMNERIPWD